MFVLGHFPQAVFVQKLTPRFFGSFFEFVVVRKVGGVVAFFNKVKVSPHNKVHIVWDLEQGLNLGSATSEVVGARC